ncbi:MAG TPA: gluconate 2-dehydrogenase subunit 3 family protein [Dehalococcoidia bacterium]|nr:gluconate 2-dehydrogenase subunit 3 family protein [Dehalococcoidia bacterium]
MSESAATPGSGENERFPGFNVLAQMGAWDRVTAGVVLDRLAMPPDIRFFTPAEEATARALFDQLLDQHEDPRVPIVNMVDARLAEQQTDGWHYDDVPEDGQAWRDTLKHLDEDAQAQHGSAFHACSEAQQAALLQSIMAGGAQPWHGLNAHRVWSLWTRYACTAFCSHPWAWNEMGFPGPAYPRGYKNFGVGEREPFEVRDARPNDDPARESRP